MAGSRIPHTDRIIRSQCAVMLGAMTLRQLIQPDDDWLDAPTPRRVLRVALAACAGLVVYGFTVGYWRDPLMGIFVAVKLPLLVALTLICNGLLNGLLGLLLGTGLGFRQSLLALLSAFALAGLILGSLAPIWSRTPCSSASPGSPRNPPRRLWPPPPCLLGSVAMDF